MAVDTRDKRGSSIALANVKLRLEQNPAGVIGQAGRQFAAYSYVGILASPVVVFNPVWAQNVNQIIGKTSLQPVTK